jgi:hypothetical protein
MFIHTVPAWNGIVKEREERGVYAASTHDVAWPSAFQGAAKDGGIAKKNEEEVQAVCPSARFLAGLKIW